MATRLDTRHLQPSHNLSGGSAQMEGWGRVGTDSPRAPYPSHLRAGPPPGFPSPYSLIQKVSLWLATCHQEAVSISNDSVTLSLRAGESMPTPPPTGLISNSASSGTFPAWPSPSPAHRTSPVLCSLVSWSWNLIRGCAEQQGKDLVEMLAMMVLKPLTPK